MVVDLTNVLEQGHVALERGGGIGRTLERGDHVVGSHLGAIVELHALAQLEAPELAVHQFPLCGQCGFQIEGLVVAHQAFIDVVQEGEVRGRGDRIGIQRIDIRARTPFHCFGVRRHRPERKRQCQHGHGFLDE
ncbi:hypothetical protein D9M68_895040 [compost metagenome]